MQVDTVHNDDVHRILVGIPENHKHLRAALELRDGRCIILQEAVLAALVRAYVNVETHPERRAARMVGTVDMPRRKADFATYQLIEDGGSDDEIARALGLLVDFMGGATIDPDMD